MKKCLCILVCLIYCLETFSQGNERFAVIQDADKGKTDYAGEFIRYNNTEYGFNEYGICSFVVDSFAICDLYNGDVYTQVFVTGGDRVAFNTHEIRDGRHFLYFEGKNAVHYNYFGQREINLPMFPLWDMLIYDPTTDFGKYKDEIKKYADDEKSFLNLYTQKRTVSNDFVRCVTDDIDNWYATKLLIAYNENRCKISAKQIADITIRQNFASTLAFQALALKYVYNDADTDIEKRYEKILSEVHPDFQSTIIGEFLEYLLSIGDQSYKKAISKIKSQYEEKYRLSPYKRDLQDVSYIYSLGGESIPDSITQKTEIISCDWKEEFTLNDLLNKFKDQSILFVIWESWCPHCLQAIQSSTETRELLSKNNIEVVFVSIDDEIRHWQETAREEGITENQYKILDTSEMPLLDYILFGGTPQFVLLNSEHKIVLVNAPQPTDCNKDIYLNYIKDLKKAH